MKNIYLDKERRRTPASPNQQKTLKGKVNWPQYDRSQPLTKSSPQKLPNLKRLPEYFNLHKGLISKNPISGESPPLLSSW